MNHSSTERKRASFAWVLVLAACTAWQASAQNAFFNNGVGDSDYSNGGNWNTTPNVPGNPVLPNANALIGSIIGGANPGTAVYNSPGLFTTTGRLLLGHGPGHTGTLTLGVGAGTLTFGGDSVGVANYVGVDGGTGILNVDDGTLRTTGLGYLRIGANGPGSNGTVNVGGGIIDVNHRIVVANGNTTNVGQLNITSGEVKMNRLDVVHNDFAGVGGTGSLSISGTGILRTQGANPRIFIGSGVNGSSGNASFSLADSGQIIADHDFIVGFVSPATGMQTGGTITVNAPGNYFVGAFSTGVVTQSDGTVTIDPASPEGLSVGTRAGGNGTYNLNGGTVELARLNVGLAGGIGAFNLGGGTLKTNGNFAPTTPIPLTGTGGSGTIDTNGFNATISGLLSGPGGLNKSGPGTLTLPNANNSFSGDMVIDGGSVQVTGTIGGLNPVTSAIGAVNTARTVTVANGGTLDLRINDVWGNAGSTPAARLVIDSGGLVTNLDRYNVFTDPTFNGGTLEANGGANASFPAYQLNGIVNVTGAGSQITVGGSGNGLTGVHLRGPVGFNVDAGADLIIENELQNFTGASGILKTGQGTLSLTGANSFTGPTTVAGGSLLINGSIPAGGITISPGARLGGNGSTTSAVTNNGVIAPGNSPGSLIVGNMLSGLGVYEWEILDANIALGPGVVDTSWDLLITDDLAVNSGVDTILIQGLSGLPSTAGLPANLDISLVGNTTGPFAVLRVDGTLTGSLMDIVVDPGNLGRYGTFSKSLEGTTDTLFLTFTSTVPEPGTYALFAILLFGGFVAIRKRRTKDTA